MNRIKLPSMNCETVYREIGDFVIDTVVHYRSSGCIVGLSGGVDSSTTAALIKTAFERHNKNGNANLELVGYILPSSINKMEDAKDAEIVARELGIRYEIHAIEKLVEAFQTTNPEAIEENYHRGNLISRVRANVLSTKAATEHKILAGTGNRDEDFGIGYYTLFGDGAVHISPIAGLSKRLVREMAAYLGVDDTIIHRIPTAGLEPGQSDFKDLGYDYDVVELVTAGFEQGFSKTELAVHDQIAPLVEKQIEHYRSFYENPHLTSVEQVIDDITARHHLALRKVKIVHPPTPEITLTYN
ncbi:tRNA-specific 2-thiouridylase MnmA (EC [Olavius sp. associated proteobacterium Delta 1]|nr:tRNA-specific 2-thiouridylase MnmA (EC [Olavius sp. associated proteobacterium Delta 1]